MNFINIVPHFILPLLFLAVECTTIVSGGSGTETTTGIVGAVINAQGYPQANVQVQLLPATCDPVQYKWVVPVDTTDSLGCYRFVCVDSGEYTLQMLHLTDRTRALISRIHVASDTVNPAPAVLHAPGTIKVSLPEGINSSVGYVFIPGTTFFTLLNNRNDFVILDSLPAGQIPEIAYSATNQPSALAIRYNIGIISGDTTVIMNPSWKYARTIGLNTTHSGADVASNVVNFPVLIKLQANNFDFTQAQSNGSDIRFTKMDTTPLPYEIERWNATSQYAEIWVKVDTIHGNDSAQYIIMYWGASIFQQVDSVGSAATSFSNGAAVFDTAAGFQGVWHMGDVAADSVHDVTLNRYHGISPDTARPQVVEGIIGACREFDGAVDFITVPNTAAGKLNFQQDGHYSVSAWVMADTFTGLQQVLISKGKYQYFLWMDSTDWKFWEFQDRAGWEASAQPASLKKWVLLTGVRDGTTQHLYVNDVPVDSLALISDLNLRNTASDLFFGRARDFGTGSHQKAGYCNFKGKMDEVRIFNVAQTPDWVRLSYMNQREDNKLVIFK